MRKKSDIVRLTKYLITLPSIKKILSIMLLVNVPLVVMFLLSGEDITSSIALMFFLSFLPITVGSYLTHKFARTKTLTLKRSLFAGLIDTIFITASAGIVGMTSGFQFFRILDGIIFGYGITIAVRTFVFYASLNVSKKKLLGTIFTNSLFGACFMIIMFSIGFKNPSFVLPLLQKLFFSILVYGFGAWMFVYIIGIPIGRGLGINMYELARGFISTWYDDTKMIEETLEKIAVKKDVPLYILGFKTNKGFKGIFLIPYFHPGPFGDVGGSGLMNNLRETLEKKYNAEVFVFHGAATHDINPVSKRISETVLAEIERNLRQMRFSRKGSHPVEITNLGNYMRAQKFGDTLLVSSSFSPEPTEDVDLGLGLALIKTGEKYHDHCIFVDAHNCFQKGDYAIYPGDPKGYLLLKNIESISKSSFKEVSSIKMGVASDNLKELPELPVGPGGLKVAVFETNGTKSAYILLDGNNLEKRLREEILESLSGLVDTAEVFTSDNHTVNVIRGGNNPIPRNKKLLEKIRDCVKKALEDLQTVRVGYSEIIIKDLPVFGTHRTGEIVSLVEATVGLIKIVAPVIFTVCSVLAAYSVSIIPWL